MASSIIRYASFSSPLGWILLAESAKGICLLEFLGDELPSADGIHARMLEAYPGPSIALDEGSALLREVKGAILRYFEGGDALSDFPVDADWGSPFQKRVWEALRLIPSGETRTYIEIARSVGAPKAARAVGGACGKNRVPILIPCHRVVASGGGMGGYTGGLGIKKALLELEKKALRG